MGEGEQGGAGALSISFRDLSPEEIDLYINFDSPISWEFLSDEEKVLLGYEEYLRLHRELILTLYGLNLRNRIIAAFVNGEIVGVVWVGMRIDSVHFMPVGYIYDIEVKEEFRGEGIGSRLLEMAEETCRKWGVSEIQLSVEASNLHALSWYGRRGYSPKRLVLSKEL